MSALTDMLVSAVPLLLASSGALVSELAGVMAVFIDGIINLSAFLFYTLTDITSNPVLGAFSSCLICMSLLCLVSIFTEKTGANPFLAGLAVNLFSAGIVSLLSSLLYKTQGVLSASPLLNTQTASASRSTLTPLVYVLILACAVLLQKTKTGRRLRITGSDPDVLFERGVSPSFYRTLSWIISGFFASLAGIFLVLKVSSFVPNISSGRGWIALAVVFLGRKKSAGIAAAVLVFAAAEFLSNTLQGSTVPSGLLIALPYAAALLLFILVPSKK